MKTIKSLYKYIVILILTGITINPCAAQSEKKDHVEKTYNISPSGSLVLSSISSDIEIRTWDRDEVKVAGEITYEDDNNKADASKLLNAFKNFKAESSGNVLKLDMYLIKSSMSNMSLFTKKNTVVLSNGDKISLDGNKIKTNYTVWIPVTLSVKIDNKYGKLKMATVKGKVDFTLYNADLLMEDFGTSGTFDIKYSSVTLGNGGASVFNAYNSKVNAAGVENVTIDSKYSKFNIAKARDVTIQSYDDTFVFGMLNDINASAKYSTIRIESNANRSKFDVYNFNLSGKNFQSMELSAKYSKLNVADIDNMAIGSSYNNDFIFAAVNTFKCNESKYDSFKFDEITNSALFPDAYDSKITIKNTGASFNSFSGKFKYGALGLKLNPNVEYNLNYNATYGKLDVATDRFKSKFVSDKNSSKTTIEGSTASDAKCKIELITYDTSCKIE